MGIKHYLATKALRNILEKKHVQEAVVEIFANLETILDEIAGGKGSEEVQDEVAKILTKAIIYLKKENPEKAQQIITEEFCKSAY